MNIYEDATLEHKLETLADQLGHLVLDFLLAGVHQARRETQIFQDFCEVKSETKPHSVPF